MFFANLLRLSLLQMVSLKLSLQSFVVCVCVCYYKSVATNNIRTVILPFVIAFNLSQQENDDASLCQIFFPVLLLDWKGKKVGRWHTFGLLLLCHVMMLVTISYVRVHYTSIMPELDKRRQMKKEPFFSSFSFTVLIHVKETTTSTHNTYKQEEKRRKVVPPSYHPHVNAATVDVIASFYLLSQVLAN